MKPVKPVVRAVLAAVLLVVIAYFGRALIDYDKINTDKELARPMKQVKTTNDFSGITDTKETIRIKAVAIGDSITYGYPYGLKFSWVSLAADKLGVTILNKGVPGETSGEMVARFEHDVIENNPEYVIILGGTNDAFYNIPEGSFRNNIYKMAKRAEKVGIKPIIGLPIPINEEPANELLSKYREWMKNFAMESNYSILDFYSLTVDESTGFIKQGFHEDGVHPSPLAYQTMAEIVEIK